MSAFAYHGVCMMMMTMTIDVWHTEVSVANGSKLENKTLHVAISNSLSILPNRRYSNMPTASPRPSQLSSLTCTWSRFKKKEV